MSAGERFELMIAHAMCADDPVAALAVLAEDPQLDEAERTALRAIDPDGARISALLVARLRFERLLRGSAEVEAWFDQAPEEFSRVFRAYHHEVPPTAFFPRDERELFFRWRERHGL